VPVKRRAAEEGSLVVPENIRKLAQKFRDERIAKIKIGGQSKPEREASERFIRAVNLKNGLVYARKIFRWTNAFRRSIDGQELMRVSHIPTAYSIIFLFDDHVKDAE